MTHIHRTLQVLSVLLSQILVIEQDRYSAKLMGPHPRFVGRLSCCLEAVGIATEGLGHRYIWQSAASLSELIRTRAGQSIKFKSTSAWLGLTEPYRALGGNCHACARVDSDPVNPWLA